MHYTSAQRINRIVKGGLYAPDGQIGRNYFVVFNPNINDPRIAFDQQMRRIRNRSIRYAWWLSHFALEKAESDGSSPAVLLAALDSDLLHRSDRNSERYLNFIGRVYTEELLEPEHIIATYQMERKEYDNLKTTYRGENNFMPIDEFFSKSKLEIDLPTAVSMRLFRGLYRQFIASEFPRQGFRH